MLINKTTYTKGDVISLKLATGEELIARFEEETPESVTLKNPLAITLGGTGVGMIPWVFLADVKTCTLSKDHIVVSALTKKDAADQYIKNTTGITLL